MKLTQEQLDTIFTQWAQVVDKTQLSPAQYRMLYGILQTFQLGIPFTAAMERQAGQTTVLRMLCDILTTVIPDVRIAVSAKSELCYDPYKKIDPEEWPAWKAVEHEIEELKSANCESELFEKCVSMSDNEFDKNVQGIIAT